MSHQVALMAGGHVYVAGWYVAMSRALSTGDLVTVRALLECGLTVTYHVRKCADLAELAAFSIGQSEECTSTERQHTDTFPAFAAKCLLLMGTKAQSPASARGRATVTSRGCWLNDAGAAVVV